MIHIPIRQGNVNAHLHVSYRDWPSSISMQETLVSSHRIHLPPLRTKRSELVRLRNANLGTKPSIVHRFGADWCDRERAEMVMGTKVRFSVNLSEETNKALEALAEQHKPSLSKSYLVEYAVLRLISAIKSKQLALPLVLEDRENARGIQF